MKHTINYIKKKLHESKLCRNFLLILTVATICISALCVPISAESPLTDNQTTYYGVSIYNMHSAMHNVDNIDYIYYDSTEDNNDPILFPQLIAINSIFGDNWSNAEFITPNKLKIYSTKTETNVPNIYMEINGIEYLCYDGEQLKNITDIAILFDSEDVLSNFDDTVLSMNNLNENTIFHTIEHNSTGVFSIFKKIGFWISTAVRYITAMFWVNGSLTFIGILAVGGLVISIVLLLIRLISSFLAFRG